MYKTEKQLVKEFKGKLKRTRKKEIRCSNVMTEFNYRSGRPDIMGKNKDGVLITFEAKLVKWRDALHQAYKNTLFAHYSYVILPNTIVKSVIKYQNEFEKRRVGLCTIRNSFISIEIPAIRIDPNHYSLTEYAINYLEEY